MNADLMAVATYHFDQAKYRGAGQEMHERYGTTAMVASEKEHKLEEQIESLKIQLIDMRGEMMHAILDFHGKKVLFSTRFLEMAGIYQNTSVETPHQRADKFAGIPIAKPGMQCPDCDGVGYFVEECSSEHGPELHSRKCEFCDGTGKVLS